MESTKGRRLEDVDTSDIGEGFAVPNENTPARKKQRDDSSSDEDTPRRKSVEESKSLGKDDP